MKKNTSKKTDHLFVFLSVGIGVLIIALIVAIVWMVTDGFSFLREPPTGLGSAPCYSASGSIVDVDDPDCDHQMHIDAKPVIYLYPERQKRVSVKLRYDGSIFASYPDYPAGGWQVTAHPDGKLIHEDKEYSYLFWEGTPSRERTYDLSKGFVVKGSETREFLQDKLAGIGLTPAEYNEFIVYWYPKMQGNPYNLIHFATYDEYDKYAQLDITPKPDSMLRVFMVFQPLDTPIEVEPQQFPAFSRQGFTVVEWGGSELSV